MIPIDTTGVDVSEEAVKESIGFVNEVISQIRGGDYKYSLKQAYDTCRALAALYNEVERLRGELEERK